METQFAVKFTLVVWLKYIYKYPFQTHSQQSGIVKIHDPPAYPISSLVISIPYWYENPQKHDI